MAVSNINELVTAFADDELSEAEKKQLMEEAERNPDVRKSMDDEVRFKNLIKKHVKRENMPEDVRNRLLATVREEAGKKAQNIPEADNEKALPKRNTVNWLLAAALVIIGAFIYWFKPAEQKLQTATVEFLTYQHYQNHDGLLPEPAHKILNTQDAQAMLRDEFNCKITVPELKGARFAGVLYADFFEGFHTPLLGYEVDEGDFIYVFAFELGNLEKYPELARDADAVKNLIRHDDVYIVKIEDREVVSWKWEDVWYSAVSNHDGAVVASMLPH
jgi:hypothetical protein